jgi:hypothetical protein
MNKVKREVVIFLIFLAYIILTKVYAEDVNLLQKNKKIYASLNTRLYKLKVKLKPKIVKEEVYWLNRKKIDWDKEIKNWQFGFLSKDESLPPIVVYGENFYSEEQNFQEKFRWMSNNARLLVLNPLKAPVTVNFIFEAASFKKERELKIWVNGEKVSSIEVPKDKERNEFNKFVIKDIVLNPGRNDILFYTPEGIDILKPEKWEEKKEREVSVKFKDFRFRIEKKLNLSKKENENLPEYSYVTTDEELNLLVNFKKEGQGFLLMSRDVNINLEEYPYLSLDYAVKENNANLDVFLGIDYNGDGHIDGYLNPESLKEINLFELAKDKCPNIDYFKYGFKLRKIIILIEFYNEKIQKEQIGILNFKNMNFYNENSLILIGQEFEKKELKFENVNVKSAILGAKEGMNILSYFDGAPVRTKEVPTKEFKGSARNKKRENEEVRVYLPLDKNLVEDFPYLSFNYKFDNPQVQEIKLYLSVQDNESKNFIPIDEDNYKETGGVLRINLKEIFKKFNPKELIIRLKRKDEVDCSLENNKGWYRFQLSNIYLYTRFPYPIKNVQLKDKFSSLIRRINPGLIKIDEEIFHLNDFKDWGNFEDLERKTLVKKIKLGKGNHKYEKLKNDTFDVEWTILEPEGRKQKTENRQEPEIIFKKINPTKYLVKVEGAKNPFWLVFSESFHKQWKVYKEEEPSTNYESVTNIRIKGIKGKDLFSDIVADYPKLKVKEAKHLMKFTPIDIKYLFKKPLPAGHYLVNGYANGWYIEPKKLGLGENFVLTIYFFPQSLFYLGLIISGLTLLFCIIYLIYDFVRKKRKISHNM